MATLLHVAASPRGERSESLALADEFLAVYGDRHPGHRVQTWNLWDGSLPEFGPAAAQAKMAVFEGANPDGDAAAAWRTAEAAFRRFAAADKYLFSVPMWNHAVPYILKQLIDVISQPGMVFSFDPERGYTGLLAGRTAAVIATSAVYGPGRPPSFGNDFQLPYLRDWLAWAGIAPVAEVEFRPNLATADVDALREIARAEARDVAKRF